MWKTVGVFVSETYFMFIIISSRRWWMLSVKSPRLFGMLKKGRILSYAWFILVSIVFDGPWQCNARLWIFPQSSLSSAEKILREVSSVKVEVSLKV